MSAIHHLIVDPNPAVQSFIRSTLETYGFASSSIKTASSPDAASEIAAEVKPDFLLTDWFGKGAITGIELHEAIVHHNPNCTLALMATQASPEQREEAEQAGAYFLLSKPFTAEEFRTSLGKAMVQLAKKNPEVAEQIAAQTRGIVKVPKIVMPDLPQYKPGDQVSYLNRRETVKHVILRRGELAVQLQGVSGLVEAAKLKRL